MDDLHDECGVAAIYHLAGDAISPLCPDKNPKQIARLMPRMLLDIQNRGQLAAGMTTFDANRKQLLDTHKDIGTVTEVFRLNRRDRYEALMKRYAGTAAIGHVRYATCGRDDRSYAQPFERHHIKRHKWFSFAFNGQLANYQELREELLKDPDNHLARETDTEIIMHAISTALSTDDHPPHHEVCREIAGRFDGAYSMVFLDALGNMMVARDPLGIKPISYAFEGPLFAAASESVALLNLGFSSDSIRSLLPGQVVTITEGRFEVRRFAPSPRQAHCFFEWVYFSNVASTLDGRSVYMARNRWVKNSRGWKTVSLDEDTVVVPVPDTSKASADAMAYKLGVPCLEGLIRNRYSGRTFIEGSDTRAKKVQTKYTPLREVLEGKRIILVEDSIVRATTLKALLERIWVVGRPREIHVRVACPPIVAPCFYGIDMSTVSELFAPQFLHGEKMSPEVEVRMADHLGATSLRYLPVESVARAIGLDADQLCRACITGQYPTPCGQRLAAIAMENFQNGVSGRTYDAPTRGNGHTKEPPAAAAVKICR